MENLININELRIGNLVHLDFDGAPMHRNEIRMVAAISTCTQNYGIMITNGSYWLSDDGKKEPLLTPPIMPTELVPIPITDELFVKTGGVIKNPSSKWEIHSIAGINFIKEQECVYKGGYDGYTHFQLPKYLHELQNICFVLNGNKELELNLDPATLQFI